MDIRSTRLLRKLHEWLDGEPVYRLMREDRDGMEKDMIAVSEAVHGKYRGLAQLLWSIKELKKEAAFAQACLKHAHELGIDTSKELGQQYRALRRDAEAMRAIRQTKLGRIFLRLTKGA